MVIIRRKKTWSYRKRSYQRL